MKFSIILFVFTLYTLHFTPYTLPVLATESSSSSNLSDDLKAKLDEFLKQSASKAAQLKQEINRKLLNKAYIGTLKSKAETSLTLASQTRAKAVTVNQDTVFESNVKSKQKLSLKTLSEEDYIAALGDVDDNGALTARKIILIPSQQEEKTYLWGQVVSRDDKLITVQARDLKNTAVSFAKASVKKGTDTISVDDLSLRDFVIITGYPGKNDILQADFIYVIPKGGVIKPKKVVTPSAQASKSAKPTIKKTN